MDVKTAIESGEPETLRQLLSEDASRANNLIQWGNRKKCLTHPLHYVSDLLFNGILEKGKELPLLEALIQAGADLDFQQDGKGDTPLIGAASLGAEEVGLMLLDAGSSPQFRGLFGETALHWASLFGEDRLVRNLIEKGADLNLEDQKYRSPPLGWAIHGWSNPQDGNPANHGRQREVITMLVAAGAQVRAEWLASEQVRADERMITALRAAKRGVSD